MTKTLLVFYHMDYTFEDGEFTPTRFAFTHSSILLPRFHCQLDWDERPDDEFAKNGNFDHMGKEYRVYNNALCISRNIEFSSPLKDEYMIDAVYSWLTSLLCKYEGETDIRLQFVTDQPAQTFPYVLETFGDYIDTNSTCIDINELISMKLVIDGCKEPITQALHEPRIDYAGKRFIRDFEDDKIYPALYNAEMYHFIYRNLSKDIKKYLK